MLFSSLPQAAVAVTCTLVNYFPLVLLPLHTVCAILGYIVLPLPQIRAKIGMQGKVKRSSECYCPYGHIHLQPSECCGRAAVPVLPVVSDLLEISSSSTGKSIW